MLSPSEPEPRPAGPWWTDHIDGARGLLRELLVRRSGPLGVADSIRLPDASLVRDLLPHFTGLDDLKAYGADFLTRTGKVNGYGFFLADVSRHWPERRHEIKAEMDRRLSEQRDREAERQREAVNQAAADSEAARRRAHLATRETKARQKGWTLIAVSDCLTCAGFGRNPETDEVCGCRIGQAYLKRRDDCGKCQNCGTTSRWTGDLTEHAWCTCKHAERLRATEPGKVDRENETESRIRESLKAAVHRATCKPEEKRALPGIQPAKTPAPMKPASSVLSRITKLGLAECVA